MPDQGSMEMINSAPIGMTSIDHEGRFLFTNVSFQDMTGYDADELLNMDVETVTDAEDYENERPFIRKLLDGEIDSYSLNKRFNCKDGTVKWCTSTLMIPDRSDQPLVIHGYIVDITEQKQAENQLRIDRKINDIIMKASADYFAYYENDDYKMVWNNKGGREDEFLCYKVWHGYHEPCDGLCPVVQAFKTGEKQKAVKELDGKHWSIDAYPIKEDNRVEGVVQIAHDITELKQKETELLKQNYLLEEATILANMGFWERDLTTGEWYFSEMLKKINGTDKNRFDRDELYDLIFEDDLDKMGQAFKKALRNKGKYTCEYRIRDKKNGELKWFNASGKVILDDREKPVRMIGFSQDITDRKKAEQEMVFTNEKLSRYFEESSAGIFVADGQGNIIDVNSQATQITGYSLQELLGMNIVQFYSPDQIETAIEVFRSVIEQKKKEIEMPFKHKSGEQRWWAIKASLLSDGSVIGFVNDITERKQFEKNLEQSERRFKILFMKAQTGIVLGNDEGKFTLVNQAIQDILGYSESEFYRMNFYDLSHPDDLKNDQIEFKKLIHGEIDQYHGEKQILTKHRGYIWVNLIASVSEDTGNANSIVAIIEDINERKLQEFELEQSNCLNQLRAQIRNIALTEDDEIVLIRSLLEMVGDKLKFENASFYVFDDERKFLQPYVQWGNITRKNTKDLKVPSKIFDFIKKKPYYIFSIGNLPAVLRPILGGLMRKYHTLSFIGIPYGNIHHPDGFISWSTNRTIKHLNDHQIDLLTELTQLIKLRIDQIRNKNALIESETKFRLISQNTSDGILVYEHDELSYVSPSFLKMLGLEEWDADKLRPYNFRSGIHPDDVETVVQLTESAIRDRQKELVISYRIQHSSGYYIWVEDSIVYEYDENGHVAKIYLIARDITDRKQLEGKLRDSLSDLKEAHRLAKMGTWEFDIVHNELRWSEEIFSILGKSPGTFTPSFEEFLNLVHPDDRSIINDGLNNSIENRVAYDITYRLLMDDGQMKYARGIGHTEYGSDDQAVRTIGTIQDVTDMKNIEIRLKKTAEELELSNRDLERFAYSASHDLKEPLRMISSFTNLIERKVNKDYSEDKDLIDYSQYAKEGANRMVNLIDSLLAFSRVKKNPSLYQTVDLNLILEQIIRDVKPALEQIKGKLIVKKLPQLVASEEQMRVVFMNLITNSIKYRSENVETVIEVSCRKKSDVYRFTVKDNGIGIAPQYHEKIFDLFTRLHSYTNYQGSGIGLSTVKRIIEFHNGKIWVDSKEGEGTIFSFTLPEKQAILEENVF